MNRFILVLITTCSLFLSACTNTSVNIPDPSLNNAQTIPSVTKEASKPRLYYDGTYYNIGDTLTLVPSKEKLDIFVMNKGKEFGDIDLQKDLYEIKFRIDSISIENSDVKVSDVSRKHPNENEYISIENWEEFRWIRPNFTIENGCHEHRTAGKSLVYCLSITPVPQESLIKVDYDFHVYE